MKHEWLFIAWTLIHVQGVSGRCANEDALDLNLDIDDYVKLVIESLHVPGVSIAVVDLKQPFPKQIDAKA